MNHLKHVYQHVLFKVIYRFYYECFLQQTWILSSKYMFCLSLNKSKYVAFKDILSRIYKLKQTSNEIEFLIVKLRYNSMLKLLWYNMCFNYMSNKKYY